VRPPPPGCTKAPGARSESIPRPCSGSRPPGGPRL
jgi:hypothetical protein